MVCIDVWFVMIDPCQEFDLKSLEWDRETISRWKAFSRGTVSITVAATTASTATLPHIVSPPRTRPVFQGVRAKLAADKK